MTAAVSGRADWRAAPVARLLPSVEDMREGARQSLLFMKDMREDEGVAPPASTTASMASAL